MSLLSEFHRRNVLKVAVAYLAGAWILLQVADTVFPLIGLGEDVARIVLLILAIGFVPALIFAWIFEWTPQGIIRESDISAAIPKQSTKGFERAIIVLLVLAVGYFVVDEFVFERAPSERSIIVLPFTSLSSDPEHEYFASGMTRELRNLLFGIEGLSVTPHTTSEAFGEGVSVAELRDRLAVSHVLEGSVQRSGNDVRIVAQLIDVRSEKPLWSEKFDGVLDDIFDLQDRTAARIVKDLRLQLAGLRAAKHIDPRAYELFVWARQVWEEGNPRLGPAARAALEEVLSIEPDFVPAMFELAKWLVTGDERPMVEENARNLAARMAEIAPESSYANSLQGWIAYNWDNDMQLGAYHFERAIADNAHEPVSMVRGITTYLWHIGRGDDAYALAKYHAERDPANTAWMAMVARMARATGRSDEAMAFLESVSDWQTPTPYMRWHLGAGLLIAGEPQKALEQFDRIVGDLPGNGSLGRIMALYDLGRTEEFEAELAAFLAAHSDPSEPECRIYAWTGQNDLAFECMEKTVEQHGPVAAAYIKFDLNSRLRSDPRYDEFLEKYGRADPDLSHIEFDPPFPPSMAAELERIRATLDK